MGNHRYDRACRCRVILDLDIEHLGRPNGRPFSFPAMSRIILVDAVSVYNFGVKPMAEPMTDNALWNDQTELRELGIKVPAWIEPDITCYDIAAICQGGCESGAYMPAVTYYKAVDTMAEHGDEIFDVIEQALDSALDVLKRGKDDASWRGMAVAFVSFAVESWAQGIHAQLVE